MRVKSFPEKLAKWECVDTQDPWLGFYVRQFSYTSNIRDNIKNNMRECKVKNHVKILIHEYE